MKMIFGLVYVLAITVFMAVFAREAPADTLDHSVQIVSGADIDPAALLAAIDREADRLLGRADVRVQVTKTGAVSTVSAVIESDSIRTGAVFALRRIVEKAIHAEGVARNGYETIRPSHWRATASSY